jgi:hypothetical protein
VQAQNNDLWASKWRTGSAYQFRALQYWSCSLILFTVICRGWYAVGAMGASDRSAAPRVPLRLGWRFHPSGRFLALQVANLAMMARLESDGDSIAASLVVHLTYQHDRFHPRPLEEVRGILLLTAY